MSRDSTLLGGLAAILAFIALCTLPALSGLIKQLRTRAPKDNFYSDQDGKSTPEAVAAFSNRWPKAFIAFFAALGCATSITLSVLSTTSSEGRQGLSLQDWLTTASWLLLAVQTVCIIATNDSVQAYNVGLWTWLSSLLLLLLLLVQDTSLLGELLHRDNASFALRIVNLVAALGLTTASITVQRRPDVFVDGKIVDRMHTVSAYSRFTWSWCTGVLKQATAKKDLEVADLPRPDHKTRARDQSAQWKAYDFKGPLWKNVIWAFRWPLIIQWLLAIFRNVVSFAPYWVTLRILRALEARQPGEKLSVETWIMVFWLGLTVLADAWFSACLFWISWSDVCIPLRGLLSALIVEKAMRRKNVKQASKTDALKVSTNEDGTKKDSQDEEEESDADALKSQQGVVNLIGVDTKRVADFAAFQFFFPASATKLAFAIWFLVSLLGWIPLLSGLATWAVILPFNIYYTKVYSNAQDRLMKIRDQKLTLVNESLQGMRQIKFSALERQWEGRILAMRERELSAIWDVFRSDSMLFGSWVAIPVLLAATSLAVYAWINETLTPSVAFVSIGVFKSLELALSLIPELTTDLVDAKVSIFRIEAYLNGPEITQTITEGHDIAFENADIAWPVDEETDDADRFILRDVNLSFPAGELSVISGKTGSGKSLLLAAILGETDLLSGKIYAPKAPTRIERNDSQANAGNWLLPHSIAYVGQIPWIENASLKDNVLFGLPYDEKRYKDTVFACALTKDLDMFTDGDKTELGTNGINLSGGQKWRVTLARAIYSRAGILVFDDIFSAVDAHVGRHIFEKCLTGPLSKGRTRILVTHHVALCESKTRYIVELGDGTVQHNGLLSELDEDGTLQLIKSHEQSHADNIGDDEATAVNSEQASDVDVDAIQILENEDTDGGVIKKVPSKSARQFVEDETREQGAIKKHVYATYLRDSGGWSWWTLATLIFVSFEVITLGRSWWLRVWTGDTAEAHVHGLEEYDHIYATSLQHSTIHAASTPFRTTQARSLNYYLAVYIAISLGTVALGVMRFFFLFLMSLKASRHMFRNMTHTVLRTPLRWLDTVPVGRILNRFTADFNIIDSRIAIDLTLTLNSALSVIGICIASMFVSPLIIVLATILLLICTRIALRYLDAARPSKRLESTTKL
ncbi:ATP-dependent bile acid permease like protein [Verticillium longisporum]|uniref:ATP-dependent bile acid permease like protein n=1 Tax=Verticillium longisporum TaxID=100787 RepID=A0A8I2ZT34_VERLO|nr:ATP-dependent bile acid permease like protein [Verticillium longisporum]